jgi:hypothetical protein
MDATGATVGKASTTATTGMTPATAMVATGKVSAATMAAAGMVPTTVVTTGMMPATAVMAAATVVAAATGGMRGDRHQQGRHNGGRKRESA